MFQGSSTICSQCDKIIDPSERFSHHCKGCRYHLCFQCTEEMIKSQHICCKTCYLDQIKEDSMKLDSHIQNIPLQIEPSPECKIHSMTHRYVCITDKEKVCPDCAVLGEHKNHDLASFDYFDEKIKPQLKCFQDLLCKMEGFLKEAESNYEEQKKLTLNIVQAMFRDLQFILLAKQGRFTHEINSFYKQKVDNLHLQMGANSLARKTVLQKISEYTHITKSSKPFELLEEDTSAVEKIILEATSNEKAEQVKEMLEQIKFEINSTLRRQFDTLEKMTLTTDPLAWIQEKFDSKLNEELLEKQDFKAWLRSPRVSIYKSD